MNNLTHLADGHSAKDVEEDEGAVGVVFAHQVAVGQPLDPADGRERKLCHHFTVKTSETKHILCPVIFFH